jgi:molecular chaperone GrpE
MPDEERRTAQAQPSPPTTDPEEALTEAPTPDPDALIADLEAAQRKAAENWDLLLRARADLENLRKRSQRDLEHAHKFAIERFAQELLGVKDSLEMGLAAAAEGDKIDLTKLLEGKELTLKLLGQVFDKYGIQEINPVGERFNPELHEAMTVQPSTDQEPNTVLTVIQKGYLLNDRLLRPAMVVVARAPEGAGQG